MASSSNPALNTIISTINTLTRATYDQWCFKVKIELGPDLFKYVNGTTPRPIPTEEVPATALITTWDKKNREAMRILIPSIVEPEFQLIRNCETANEIWTILEANFKDTSMLRQCNTFEQLISLKYLPEKSIHDHISAFNKLFQEIKTYPNFKDLPDAIWVTRFLRSLPPDYAAFARSYDKELNTTKLNDVFGHLRSEYNNRTTNSNSNDAATPPTSTANFASNTPSKNKKKNAKNGKGADKPSASSTTTSTPGVGCDYCHKTNHPIEDCHALKYKKFYELHNPPLYSKKNSKRINSTPPAVGTSPAVGTVATYESGYSSVEPSASAMLSSSSPDIWVIDSGASDYMVPFPRSYFKHYSTDVPGPRTIKGISGDAEVHGIGTIELTTDSGGKLVLKDVLHAPTLPYALLSVGRLMQSGCTVTFKTPYCIITNSTGFTIKSEFSPSFGATSYLFRFRATFPPAESNAAAATPNIPSDDQITLIHARLAHVAISTLFQVAKVSIIPDSWKSAISGAYNGDSSSLGVCEPCLEGKQTRLPYPGVSNSITAPLELIHSDTCNVPVPS